MAFENNIFINCPFDKKYKPILKAIVFCIVYLDYKPLLSETINSADSRVYGILNLIGKAKYSIHDLSRMESSKKNQLSRFNMPFELGLDLGAQYFGEEFLQEKKCMVIMDDKHVYDEILSDFSGNDIASYSNPGDLVKILRSFFVHHTLDNFNAYPLDSPETVHAIYAVFLDEFSQGYETNLMFSKQEVETIRYAVPRHCKVSNCCLEVCRTRCSRATTCIFLA